MSYFRLAFIFLFICCAGLISADKGTSAEEAKTDSKNFVFIRPDAGPPHPFFDEFESAMRAATENLNDHLKVYYANVDHYRMIEIIEEIASSSDKPDAVIFMAMRNNGQQALEVLEKAEIDGFIVNAGLTQQQEKTLGLPREKVKHWLGEMLPDDVGAGRLLAQALYEQAITANPELAKTGVKMLAIEANAGDAASILRAHGLKEFAATQPNLEILQIVKGKWDKGKAKELTAHMLKRYGHIDAVWAASDAMASGASEAIVEAGLIPSEQVFIGGVDWSQEGLQEIAKGTLSVSAGGHILEGAWAAIILHDYYNGYDFVQSEGLRMNSPMYIVNKKNLADIKNKMGSRNWKKTDFKQFSKHYNLSIKEYNFTLSE